VILYLDASALVKRYVMEAGSKDVISLTAAAAAVATSLVSRAEVAAALARLFDLASSIRMVAHERSVDSHASGQTSRGFPPAKRW
jgi:predicted nucleic acid-binding protein